MTGKSKLSAVPEDTRKRAQDYKRIRNRLYRRSMILWGVAIILMLPSAALVLGFLADWPVDDLLGRGGTYRSTIIAVIALTFGVFLMYVSSKADEEARILPEAFPELYEASLQCSWVDKRRQTENERNQEIQKARCQREKLEKEAARLREKYGQKERR